MNRATFQTRARVIELLGKEQIADAATAVSELLKNAIDALALDAHVRYSPDHNRLHIDDNGLGMRTSDLLDRWLVVATESKRLPSDPSWLAYASDEQRQRSRQYPPLGQKGIGRLAAASLGSGVLIWTRWGEGAEAQRTLMLIHWGLFAHPTLRLDEIVIPYISAGSCGATAADAHHLAIELRDWLESPDQVSKWSLEVEADRAKGATLEYARQVREISRSLRADRREIVRDITDAFIPALSDDIEFSSTAGTSFVILSPTEQAREVFDLTTPRSSGDDESQGDRNVDGDILDPMLARSELKKLLGFSDPFGKIKPRMRVALSVNGHDISSIFRFWTPDDYAVADHEIDLSIDWAGVAKGTIRRYEDIFDYEFYPPNDLPRYHRYPGPFKLHIGYVVGKEGSHLQPNEFAEMDKRLRAFGALYVFRDGIRVLPYGTVDNDFLGFEERRTHHAGRNFFSHRRMFGGVYIDTNANNELKDKAGREGFIKNGSYRGFVTFLQNIFHDLGQRYYGTEAAREYELGVLPNTPRHDVSSLLQEKSRAALDEFLRTLPKWRRQLTNAEGDIETDFETLDELLSRAEKQNAPTQESLREIERSLERMRRDVFDNLDELGIDPPAIVAIPESTRPTFDAYLSDRQRYEINANATISSLAHRCTRLARGLLPDSLLSERIRSRVDVARVECLARIDQGYEEFRIACMTAMNDFAPTWRDQQIASLKVLLAPLGADPVAAILADSSGACYLTLESALAEQYRRTRDMFVPFWAVVSSQISDLRSGASGNQAIGTLTRSLEKLQDTGQILSELAQIGLIVEAVDHDYYKLFRNLGTELNELAGLVQDTPEALDVISRINLRVASIDQKAQLLSPVFRTFEGTRETVSGTDIKEFLTPLFTSALLGGMEIEYTDRFLETRLTDVYKPVVLAATANLVDNSIYWTSRTNAPRRVRFSSVPDGFVISDSGPGIAPRDRERVFEPFFSRRPYGRGLGLYITRTNLESKDMRIYVASEEQTRALSGANFIITKRTLQ